MIKSEMLYLHNVLEKLYMTIKKCSGTNRLKEKAISLFIDGAFRGL